MPHIDLTKLSRDLKTVDKKFAAAVRKNIRVAAAEGGAELVAAVKASASWSTRIPAATSLAVTFSTRKAGARIKVDKKKAPHARPYEQGSKDTFDAGVINQHGGFKTVNGRKVARNRLVYGHMRKTGIGMGRVLRHPVYGKGGWAEEPTRPFFFSAIEASTPAVGKAFQAAVDRVAGEAGFK